MKSMTGSKTTGLRHCNTDTMKKTHTTITVPVAVSELVRPVAFGLRESNSKFFTKAGEARARKILKLDKVKGQK